MRAIILSGGAHGRRLFKTIVYAGTKNSCNRKSAGAYQQA